jgi:hypothetical protein
MGDEGLLAEAMLETAKAMPTSPEFLFTTLIPTAATLIGTSSRIVIKAKSKYKQPCIFWTAVVARSGQLKTPAQKVILDPLIQLEIKPVSSIRQTWKNTRLIWLLEERQKRKSSQ